MRPRAILADVAAAAREHPVATALEVGTFLGCLVLFGGTLVALTDVPPSGRGDGWLALIVLGAGIVLLWTFVVPLYDRLPLED